MGDKYQPSQKVFLTGGNNNLYQESARSEVHRWFLYDPFKNSGGIKVREFRIYPSREETEAAILNRKR